MKSKQIENKGYVSTWGIKDLDGLECFSFHNIIHYYSRHSHDSYCIGIIENGQGGNSYRGSTFHLTPGKLVVMNPDEVHTGYVLDENPWSYRMLHIDEDTFKKILPEKSQLPYFNCLCFDDQYWYHKLRNLHMLLEGKTDCLTKQIHFIETISNFVQIHGKAKASFVTGREPLAIKIIKDFLNAHYNESISIDDLVNITQLNRAYLIRMFQKNVGIPPYTYLLQIRVKQAKKLLSQGMAVVDIAYNLGFADQSHFTRQFKSMTGITPKRYAKGHYNKL